MKSDVIIVGAELDGQIAALRLLEQGHSVRLFCRGAGSLHSAPGGIHLLGYNGAAGGPPLESPMDGLMALEARHPYRLVGPQCVEESLKWFFKTCETLGQSFRPNGGNTLVLTPAGLTLPTFAPFRHQASVAAMSGKTVAVVSFRGHRDFPVSLVLRGLESAGLSAAHVELEPPEGRSDSVAIARAFDRLADPAGFFRAVGQRLAPGTELVLFPALLGLEQHAVLMGHAADGDFLCLEVPTLPPSVPGMRLACALEKRMLHGEGLLHQGVAVAGQRDQGGRIIGVMDERNRVYQAKAFILASGGVLMGGLEVESHGQVREATFGLEVAQTAPLEMARVDHALDALHRTGIETDQALRPRRNGSLAHDNLFVTGTTLGHWNPLQEASGEGVSIATGWAAAEAARAALESQ